MLTRFLTAAIALLAIATAPAQSFTVRFEGSVIGRGDTIHFWSSAGGSSYTVVIADERGPIATVHVPGSDYTVTPLVWTPPDGRGRPESVVTSHVGKLEGDDIDAVCTLDCFPAETVVPTPAGPVAIAELGDDGVVLGSDGRATRIERVVCSNARDLVALESAAGSLRSTPGHRFLMADGEWKAAREIGAGDRLAGGGGEVEITAVRALRLERPVAVYSLLLRSGEPFRIGAAELVTASARR
ncbi:MAG: hypothetical protein KDE27_09445 [Planctomycetes bacterium]|nr:hypothetical protein [Planctomycetota bacterium]